MSTERRTLIMAGCGAALSVAALVGVATAGGVAWRAWLGAAVLWAAAPVGAVMLGLMVRIIPGSWRASLAPALAAQAQGIAPAVLALAPLLLAPSLVYRWAQSPE